METEVLSDQLSPALEGDRGVPSGQILKLGSFSGRDPARFARTWAVVTAASLSVSRCIWSAPVIPRVAVAVSGDGTITILIPPLCPGDEVLAAEVTEVRSDESVVQWGGSEPIRPTDNELVLGSSGWERAWGEYRGLGEVGVDVYTSMAGYGLVVDLSVIRPENEGVFFLDANIPDGEIARVEYETQIREEFPCE